MAAPSVIVTLDYIAGYFVIGLCYWMFNGILIDVNTLTPGTALYMWCSYGWHATLFCYIIFGTYLYYIKLKEYDIIRR